MQRSYSAVQERSNHALGRVMPSVGPRPIRTRQVKWRRRRDGRACQGPAAGAVGAVRSLPKRQMPSTRRFLGRWTLGPGLARHRTNATSRTGCRHAFRSAKAIARAAAGNSLGVAACLPANAAASPVPSSWCVRQMPRPTGLPGAIGWLNSRSGSNDGAPYRLSCYSWPGRPRPSMRVVASQESVNGAARLRACVPG
jgi:hypothetical protein